MALTGLRELLKQNPEGRGYAGNGKRINDDDWTKVQRWREKGYSLKQIYGIVKKQVPYDSVGSFSSAYNLWAKAKHKRRKPTTPRKQRKRPSRAGRPAVISFPRPKARKTARKRKPATDAQVAALKKARKVLAANRRDAQAGAAS